MLQFKCNLEEIPLILALIQKPLQVHAHLRLIYWNVEGIKIPLINDQIELFNHI